MNVKSKDELEKFKGKFAGKIVLYGDVREVKPHDKPDLDALRREVARRGLRLRVSGRTAAVHRATSTSSGTSCARRSRPSSPTRRSGRSRSSSSAAATSARSTCRAGASSASPSPWRRSRRSRWSPSTSGASRACSTANVPVQLELDVKVHFVDEDLMQWNTIAEIPGTDKKDEVVMLGAHLDSWHGGTGATDNGAGSVVAMEVMRILKALNVKPRRTIRIGLWTGEEQGLYGSHAYVVPALRLAPRTDGGREGQALVPPEGQGPAHGQARAREAGGVLQPRQRDRKDPRNLRRGERRRRSDLRGVARAVPRPGCDDRDDEHDRRHRPRVVRRRGAAGIPVHPGRDRVRHPDAPHEHGPVRAAPEGRTSSRPPP